MTQPCTSQPKSLPMFWRCSSPLHGQFGSTETKSSMRISALLPPRFGRWQKIQLRNSMKWHLQIYTLLDHLTCTVGPLLHLVSSKSTLMGLHLILRSHPAQESLLETAKAKQLLPSTSPFSPITHLSWWRCQQRSKVYYLLKSYSSFGLCLKVINAINNSAFGTPYKHIIQDISHAQSSFVFCSFRHLNQAFNFAAHELEQFARRNRSVHLWKGVTPSFLEPLVQADMLH